MMGEKKFSELVLEEREKGNVVYLALDAILSAPVKEIIKQPVDGLLWDLNRDEATALTFMDREGMAHWVNNFAVALVIRELKSQLAKREDELDEEKEKTGKLRHDLAEWLSLARRQYAEMPHNEPTCPHLRGINKTEELLNVELTERKE